MPATISQATQDAVVAAMVGNLQPEVRAEIFADMTPRERRDTEAALARHSLRRRTAGRTWSTEKTTRLIITPDLTVDLVPGDHGGWQIWAGEHLVLTTDGRWTPADLVYGVIPAGVVLEDHLDAATKWPTQAAAVKAICATL
ncbi:hypothetical protein AB0C10_21290 [Microbispora amethystogenes]|uniref:hypothetical protein n=1 Tax=Microbispora amethystogenes TaxID=1427754 RepID=UPI0033D86838